MSAKTPMEAVLLGSQPPRGPSESRFPPNNNCTRNACMHIKGRQAWTRKCGERACDRIRQAGQEVGVAGFTLLSLRHSFATHARRHWGLSAIELADVLRHTSPATQRWYVHEGRLDELVSSVKWVSYHI